MFKAQTMMIQIAIVVMMFVGMIFSSCTISINSSEDDKTPRTTKTYDLKDFQQIHLAGSGNVVFVQDSAYSVKVEATEATIAGLDITSEGGQLSIGHKESVNRNRIVIGGNNGGYTVTVKAPALSFVSIAGSGKFHCNSLTATKFAVALAGSGDVCIKKLRATEVNAEIAGSGDINLDIHNANSATFSIAGSGDIDAKLTNCGHATASVAGSGDIRLAGKCRSYEKNVMGSGDIDVKDLTASGK